jgi:hypothetical protein
VFTSAEGNAAAATTDPMAAELERVIGEHAEAVEECAVLGLNVAALEPVAPPQKKKKKKKAKATEQEVTTFTVPESDLDRDIRRIIDIRRLSAGSMFAACGAKALSEDSVLVGLIERENTTENVQRKKAKAAHVERTKLQAAGKAILARQCALGGKELKTLIAWYEGPRCGSSGKSVVELTAWWDRLKGDEAPVIEPLGEEEPLPYDGILVRLRARMAATPVCPPLPPPAPLAGAAVVSPAPLVDVEGMTVDQLEAVLAIAAAQRDRLQRKEQEAEQATSFSTAAADDAAGLT